MYTSVLVSLLAAFAPFVAAQGGQGGLPPCAQSCIGDSIQKTGCQLIDYNCICSAKEIIAGLACCVSKTCNQADIDQTIKFANGICAQAKPPVTLQQAATCAPASAPTPAPGGSSSGTAVEGPVATPTPLSSGATSNNNNNNSQTSPPPAGATAAPSGGTAPTPASGNAAAATPSHALAAPANRVEYAAGVVGALVAAVAFFL